MAYVRNRGKYGISDISPTWQDGRVKSLPHPEERPLGRVSKDECYQLTVRDGATAPPHHEGKRWKASHMSEPLQIGLLLFPKVTQLDFTGPLQVLARLPGAKIHLIWKRIEPVPSDSVLTLNPTISFADCPQLDVICVPGGAGTDALVNDAETLDFLRTQAKAAKYITSVCTGSLVLGAAGLLRGYNATTHWSAMQYLSAFGANPTKTRVCVDRNRITGGGVTAGIDFALTLVSILANRKTAETIQLGLEYNPAPPFNSGSPDTAPPEILAFLKERIAASSAHRSDAINRAAARLSQPA
jgi:cyclohexyl-isocyanide hydratase